jgi:hypothetical protein
MGEALAVAWNESVSRLRKMNVLDPAAWMKEKKIVFAVKEVSDSPENLPALLPEIPTYYKGNMGFSIAPESISHDMEYRLGPARKVKWTHLQLWKAEEVEKWVAALPEKKTSRVSADDAQAALLGRVKRNMRILSKN